MEHSEFHITYLLTVQKKNSLRCKQIKKPIRYTIYIYEHISDIYKLYETSLDRNSHTLNSQVHL